MFSHPVFFILPLFVPLLQVYISFAMSLAEIRFLATSTHQVDKRCAHQFPTQKPECPACQESENPEPIPEMPPVIEQHMGRPRSVDTSNHYCPNSDCSYYGWLGLNNIISNGHPNGGIWRQLQCVVCGKYFMETTGTIFYGSQTPPQTIWMALSAIAEGLDIRGAARVFRVKPNTIQDWLNQASKHMETVSRYLLHDLHLTQVQVDELWALMGKRQDKDKRNANWVWVALDPVSKLFVAFVVGDRSLSTAQLLIHAVVQVLALGCVPLFMSDQWASYATALLTHFGYWCKTPRRSKYGPSPSPRWKPLPILHYAQVVKKRVNGRVVGVSRKLVYGNMAMVEHTLSQSGVGRIINTAFIERLNLSIRQHVAAMGRKVIGLAKTKMGLEAQLGLYQSYHNFCLPNSSLRLPLPQPQPTRGDGSPRKWQQRTPAMAVGITDHIWRMEELLLFRAPPWRQTVNV
jgi:IS1 family transposase